MFSILTDWSRLIGAAYRLSRHDALIPHEYEKHVSGPIKLFGKITRIGAKLKNGERELRPGERLAIAFEGMGPAYVKLGQFMATRPDFIGMEMANDLSRLQDRMPPFAQATAIEEIERTFSKPITDLFSSFSEPIAAASVAQVHKATLSNGRTVAVKILRPDIEKITIREFRAFARGAKTIEFFSRTARRLEPVKFIETLRASAAIELDLRMEAGAASSMAESLGAYEDIYAPDVIWPLTSQRVLTLDWIDGVPVSNTKALEEIGADRKEIAVKVLQLFLTQALLEGFFHADLHQGNLLIDKKGKIVLIDFGIMGRLDETARTAYAQILHGFVTRDYQRTAQAHFDAGYVSSEHSVETFAQALRAVGEPLYGRNADAVDMSRVLQQLFAVTELFGMHLRPELVLLQRTMVSVEGVARMLDPQINMWDAAAPIVKKYVEDEVGPRRQLERLRTAMLKTAEIAPKIPEYVETIAQAAQTIANENQLPDLNNAKNNALSDDREQKLMRMALWFTGTSMLILALITLLR